MTAQTSSTPAAARDVFLRLFGAAPRVFRAPGRINIIGEHTDHQDGFVLPAAIDRNCYVAAAPNTADVLRVHACVPGETAVLPLDRFTRAGDWRDYVAGVALVLGGEGVRIGGADMVVHGDVPLGAGLSSSAALEVAVGLALLGLAGASVDPLTLARSAQRAERDYAGAPCGVMDQVASACGRAGCALLLDCRTLAMTEIPLPDGARFVIFDTAMAHDLRDGGYRTRVEEAGAAAAYFGRALRDVTPQEVAESRLAPPLKARARHVTEENARVLACAQALAAGDLACVGGLMSRSHASLRDDFDVSTPALDLLAQTAARHPGCHGARLMGAGFGGSVIALADADATSDLSRSVSAAFEARFSRAPRIMAATASAGASEIAP